MVVTTKHDAACSELRMAVFLRAVADALNCCRDVESKKLKSQALNWLFNDMYAKDREIIGDQAGIDISAWQTDLRRILIDRKDASGHKIEISASRLKKYLSKGLSRHGTVIE